METRVYSWGDGRPWHSYAAYCRRHFGGRVRKIAVDAGLSCPNRDGTIGSEGCTFCDNRAFTPSYCSPRKSLTRQIDEGIAFHAARGRDEGLCLVYFQPFSNTHAPVARLRELYAEALAHPRISGLVIGTRPDCVDDEKLDLLAELARKRYVAVEYGVESTCDETLRAVRRGHDFAAARQAIAASAARGLHVGAHFILGLPGEDDEMLLRQVERINALPLETAKFHQLQLVRGTTLAAQYDAEPGRFRLRTSEEYLSLVVEVLRRLRPDMAVERIASEVPMGFHHLTQWHLTRVSTLWSLLEKRLTARNAYQGEIFIPLRR